MESPLVPGLPDVFVLAWVAAVGALVGSFLNVVIYRVPARRSIAYPGSRCGFCESPIRWYDNVPVISWLVLGARCRSCGVRIPARYAIVEALTAVAFVAVVLRFGVTPHAPVYAAFVAALIAATFIDVDHRIIPDSISKPGVVAGLAVAALLPPIAGSLLPVTLRLAIAGAFLGYISLLAVAAGGRVIFGREAMGLGDVKLLAMIGAFLGPLSLPFVFGAAGVTGAVFGVGHALARGRRIRGGTIPFGPFLALGAVVYLLVGSELVLDYLRAVSARGGAS